MQYRALGRTGIKVSPCALGALALGTPIGNPDPDDSARIIHKALDAGINFPRHLRRDEIVPPGTDVGTLDQAYRHPALLDPSLCRRTAANAPLPDRAFSTTGMAAGPARGYVNGGFALPGPHATVARKTEQFPGRVGSHAVDEQACREHRHAGRVTAPGPVPRRIASQCSGRPQNTGRVHAMTSPAAGSQAATKVGELTNTRPRRRQPTSSLIKIHVSYFHVI